MPEIIINGGDPLPGCPESWEDAFSWEAAANQNKDQDYEPKWRFDCGFKLDFDGPLVSIESRFYPPKKHYGPKWGGRVVVRILGELVNDYEIESDSLDELKTAVERHVQQLRERIWF